MAVEETRTGAVAFGTRVQSSTNMPARVSREPTPSPCRPSSVWSLLGAFCWVDPRDVYTSQQHPRARSRGKEGPEGE